MHRWLTWSLLTVTIFSLLPVAPAEAGPLLDWWRNRFGGFNRNEPVVTAYSPNMAGCQTCVQTCQRVSVRYEPQTRYRSLWVQTPVTSYRPTTTADPCTGCQVTCMRPCTTYQWSLRRVPYTTYRPVYETQTVQMPVTANMGAGCSSCTVPGLASPATNTAGPRLVTTTPANGSYPGAYNRGTPNGTSWGNATGASPATPYGGGTIADTAPSLPPAGSSPPTGSVDASRIPLQQPYTPLNERSILQSPPAGDGQIDTRYEAPRESRDQESPSDPARNGENRATAPEKNYAPRRIESPEEGTSRHTPLLDPQPFRRQTQPATAPQLLPRNPHVTSSVRLHRPWDYSPIRQASYQVSATPAARESRFVEAQRAIHHEQTNERSHRNAAASPERRPASTAVNRGWRSLRD